MRKVLLLLMAALCLLPVSLSAQKNYQYVSYSHDSLHTRIYTLDNGLKVFLTVYKDSPRIQCLIPVRVGSKNDPAETTGLAHYLEHLMFKGTPSFGTLDWEAEKPLLDRIEQEFEVYRVQTDKAVRDSIYRIIDSLSYVASGYAIPNEYDKMMSFIGSKGTNAATSNDYTVYIEDIPSNQLENWAIIQADRFMNPVLRLFHTELETVYEEKNTSLANDSRQANEMMLKALFPNSPYGQQTTLGRAEHLKNPSITNIRNFVSTYYVPNNMAVCLSGDFDYDEAIAIIDRYFGKMQAKELPHYSIRKESPIESPVACEVVGHEAPFVTVAFRMDLPANHKDIYILRMLDNMLSNGKCGIIDLNLNQKHLVSTASAYPYVLCDNSAYVLYARPNAGQTLEEVKDLLLEQIELLKQGKFDENLLQAAVNNMRLGEMKKQGSNRSRAFMLANAFENDIDWYYASQSIDLYSKITKDDILAFAKRHFKDGNYVVVYKRQGEPAETAKVAKPAITAIQLNRDAESGFFKQIRQREVKPIEPVFVDFSKSITFDAYRDAAVNYIHNDEDGTFTLKILFNAGELNDLYLPCAVRYLNFLGTSKMTAEEVKTRFYQLACSYYISCSDDETEVVLSGLSENFGKALDLMMDVFANAVPSGEALQHVIDDALKTRQDAKTRQNSVMNCLRSYAEYGPELVNYQLSEEQIRNMDGEKLLASLRALLQCKPEFFYYGPVSVKKLKAALKKNYKLPKTYQMPAPCKKVERLATTENVVYYAPYPARQSRVITSMRSGMMDASLLPVINMYNQYFGGSMNAIVFQEMREKRSLAYSATSAYVCPQDTAEYMYNYSYIATQNDKIVDALVAFDSLFNNMPESETAFELARKGAKSSIAASRVTKMSILNMYQRNRKMGIDHDYRRDFYNLIDAFTMKDIKNFNAKYIKNKPKTYMILAADGEVDFDAVQARFGRVVKLTLTDIFGY